MPYGESSLRHAVPSHAHSIAKVDVGSRRGTYTGLLPDAVVNRFSIEKRERFWADTLAKAGPGQVVLVGCNECHEVVGFAAGGAERTGKLGCDGELYALYLLPEVQRQRLGTLLFYRLVFELRLRGFHSMAVWVLAEVRHELGDFSYFG